METQRHLLQMDLLQQIRQSQLRLPSCYWLDPFNIVARAAELAAQAAQQRAESERQRADAAEAELARLRALLEQAP